MYSLGTMHRITDRQGGKQHYHVSSRDVNEARVSWGRGQKVWGQGQGQKKSCEAEANIYEAEAMRPVTTMHLHSTTKNLFMNI